MSSLKDEKDYKIMRGYYIIKEQPCTFSICRMSPAVSDTQSPECQAVPIIQSIKLLRDQNILKVREEKLFIENLFEAPV